MKRKYKIFGFLALLLVLLLVFHSFFLESAAKFLIVQDKLEKSDVIIVLGGDANGERLKEGAKLYKEGYARYFIMSGGQLYWRDTYAGMMRNHAVYLGVPGSAIFVEDRSESTYENAKLSLPIMKKRGFKSAILVTSPTHSRRARRTFRRIFNKAGIRVLCFPSQKSRFKLDKWWTRQEDQERVIVEYIKFIGYVLKGW